MFKLACILALIAVAAAAPAAKQFKIKPNNKNDPAPTADSKQRSLLSGSILPGAYQTGSFPPGYDCIGLYNRCHYQDMYGPAQGLLSYLLASLPFHSSYYQNPLIYNQGGYFGGNQGGFIGSQYGAGGYIGQGGLLGQQGLIGHGFVGQDLIGQGLVGGQGLIGHHIGQGGGIFGGLNQLFPVPYESGILAGLLQNVLSGGHGLNFAGLHNCNNVNHGHHGLFHLGDRFGDEAENNEEAKPTVATLNIKPVVEQTEQYEQSTSQDREQNNHQDHLTVVQNRNPSTRY